MKKTKLAMLVVVSSLGLIQFGCYGTIHQVLYHVSDLTQWAAAISYLTTT